MTHQKIKIGTRRSELALTQTTLVQQTLQQSGINANVEHIVTTGDKDLRPFQNIIGDGFFTKEIERSLLKDSVQLAVHSCKDLPSMTHIDLPWVAFSEREDTADILITKKEFVLSENPIQLKPNLVIGTSSPRRSAQLQKLFPKSKIQNIRGNVPTRVQKVSNGEFDATVLAKAGVNRLNLKEKILNDGLVVFDLPLVTAPCQGILAVQGRTGCQNELQILKNQSLTEIALAEKNILALLGGGCHLAVGAKIQKLNEKYNLDFFLAENDTHFEFHFSESTLTDLLRGLVLKLYPSSGPRVILTQPLQHQLKILEKISKINLTPIPCPLREVFPAWCISDFEDTQKKFQDFTSIIFTSQFAVQVFMNEFISLYPELLEQLRLKKIYAVGDATKNKLLTYGHFNISLPPNFHAQSVIDVVTDPRPLFIGSKDSILLNLLKNNQKNHDFLRVYESFKSAGPLSKLPEFKASDKMILTSASAARDFVEIYLHNMAARRIQIYSFGPTTSKVLKENNIPYLENPKSGSWDDLLNLLKDHT